MKRQFLAHFEAGAPGKVLLRFGQAHLFRGYDMERGVSTLGDFISEFAIAATPPRSTSPHSARAVRTG